MNRQILTQATDVATSIIRQFEGCSLDAYQDPVGIWTIGWGSTLGVKRGDRITQEKADAMLLDEVHRFIDCIDKSVTVDLTVNQAAALVSFSYNVGCGAFKKSTLLRKLNAGDYTGAAREFDRWNKAGGRTLGGLTRRRAAERALFEGGTAPTTQGKQPMTARQIQAALNKSISANLKEDGVVGPLTLAKVREFQQRHNLSVDGIVGPITEAALRTYL